VVSRRRLRGPSGRVDAAALAAVFCSWLAAEAAACVGARRVQAETPMTMRPAVLGWRPSHRMNVSISNARIAIAIPCHNEDATILKVVQDFRAACPSAAIHVFDNASTDRTAQIAREAGATVHYVPFRGKGHVVRAIFRQIDADVTVIVDGDDTYPADSVGRLIEPVLEGRADMVVATRLESHSSGSFRPFHLVGNRLVAATIGGLFRAQLRDILSGYRAFSRRFLRTSPVLSNGFEVETELTVQALERNLFVQEIPITYRQRPPNSVSKLNTVTDGVRIVLTILRIYRDFRPLVLFGGAGLVAIGLGLVTGLSVLHEFEQYRRVLGAAKALLAVGLCLGGGISVTAGVILDSMNRRVRELYTLIADQMLVRL
jgi:glycosyltransferase involved in cell wall biosynthesis